MRHYLLLFLLFSSPLLARQEIDQQSAWIVDDFKGDALSPSWQIVEGNWSISEERLVPGGAADRFGILNTTYVMRTKAYTLECSIKGTGGGALFCLEKTSSLTNGHAVYFAGNAISTGYFDFMGKYVETRVVSYIQPQGELRLRVYVDPLKKTYSLFVQDRDVALEELRFVSGYSGLYSTKPGVFFDYFQVLGHGPLETPSFYLKSQQRQIDHLSYMSLMDESLLVSNPIIGIVQRITSVGSFVQEIPIQGPNAVPRGVAADDQKWIFVVDGGQGALRIFNQNAQVEKIVASDLNDPRGVAVDETYVYVVDRDGIKVFDKKGTYLGVKAAGMFRDPKNIFHDSGTLYVADFGNGQVVLLNAKDFTQKLVIKENLIHPWDVCTDPQNNQIYVADPAAGAVFKYDGKGTYIEKMEPITIKGFISPRAVRVRGNMVYVGDFERILGFKKGVLAIRPALRLD